MLHPSTRPPGSAIIAIVVSAAVSIGCAAPAHAAKRVLKPSSVEGRTVTFDLGSLGTPSIRRASVSVGRRSHRVAARHLRTARRRGELVFRLRASRVKAAKARRARLVLITAAPAKRPAERGPAPAPSAPSQGTTTAPKPGAPRPASPGAANAITGAVSCGFGSFKSGTWPGGCWRPYADSSPFNTTIPASPRVAGSSTATVARLAQFGTPQHLVAGNADTTGDWSHPTFWSAAGDPYYTLHCYESSWGRCAIEGMVIRVPDKARPAGGGDAHMTVVDQAGGWEYDLYKVRSKPQGGGTLEFRWGGRTRIDGDGRSSSGTAARFGNLAGIVRAEELQAGRIDHALFMVVECDSGGFVYPALKAGRSCASLGQSATGAPAMGTRFQLTLTEAQISGLSVPAWKKTILRAMARYGLYVGDTGTSSWGIQLESGTTYTSFGTSDPFVTFARSAGISAYKGTYPMNLRDGVDWTKHLRVIDPCTTQKTC